MSSRRKPSCCRAKLILPTATRRSRQISSIFIAPSGEDGRSQMWAQMARRDRTLRHHRARRSRPPLPRPRDAERPLTGYYETVSNLGSGSAASDLVLDRELNAAEPSIRWMSYRPKFTDVESVLTGRVN